ncbi:hypothetical protein CC2G_002369 [Coprinopsis cinerea AmutBmut pab1-1]|nr:hypothetical protein CC2G_002369 [Coprinopsis cinerea AmutBmut pab1-1]
MHRPNKRPRLSEPDGFAQTSKPPPPKISAPKFANAFDAPKTTKPVSRGGDVKLAESVFWKGGADGKEKDKGKEDAGAKDRKDKGKEKEVAVRPPPKLQPVRSVKEKGRETLLGYQLPPPLPDVAKPSSSNSKTLKPLGVPQLHVQPRHPPVQQPKVPISARMEAPPLPLPGLNPNTTTAAKESKIIVDPSVLFAVENLVKPDDEGEANVDERRRGDWPSGGRDGLLSALKDIACALEAPGSTTDWRSYIYDDNFDSHEKSRSESEGSEDCPSSCVVSICFYVERQVNGKGFKVLGGG